MAAPIVPSRRLQELAKRHNVTLATLSRVIGRRDGYMARHINHQVPRELPADARATLARFFGVSERELGG